MVHVDGHGPKFWKLTDKLPDHAMNVFISYRGIISYNYSNIRTSFLYLMPMLPILRQGAPTTMTLPSPLFPLPKFNGSVNRMLNG